MAEQARDTAQISDKVVTEAIQWSFFASCYQNSRKELGHKQTCTTSSSPVLERSHNPWILVNVAHQRRFHRRGLTVYPGPISIRKMLNSRHLPVCPLTMLKPLDQTRLRMNCVTTLIKNPFKGSRMSIWDFLLSGVYFRKVKAAKVILNVCRGQFSNRQSAMSRCFWRLHRV